MVITFNFAGKRLFYSGPTMGNALNWAMTTESDERVAHGVYLPSVEFFSDVALQDLTLKAHDSVGLGGSEDFLRRLGYQVKVEGSEVGIAVNKLCTEAMDRLMPCG